MLKTAIAVDADLASRIAIRCACQLGRSIDMSVGTIHALEPGEEGHAIATGWVRQTWEDAVVRESMDQVTRLVKSEQAGCRMLEPPLFLPPENDRGDRIARHLRSNHCNLFVEGFLHRYKPDLFMEKIGSRFYRTLPCPTLMAQNVPPMSKGVLWLSQGKVTEKMMETYLGIFPNQAIELELLICRFGKNPSAAAKDSSSASGVEPAVSFFESAGGTIKNISTVEGSPSSMAALVRDHFLIVSSVPPQNSLMAQLLSKSPCSLLFLP
ncbi:MAG: hypothetical protein KKC30_15355 [Proteobacteria bacterium]|nr:hypothetical protein [Pseudomonadota bacterium]MBU4381508.1 hypothetical protein [Pseudomonadota bacterium]MCG2766495.1 hypothetical protein [Desulfarculaceae bacterium]